MLQEDKNFSKIPLSKISYDKNQNSYDNLPYSTPFYKSIYEGISIEIYIVNHCNLNCAGCNRFAPLAKPWYITIEDFKNELQLIKNNIPNVKQITLMGGEPTLHPDLLELCAITRTIYPNITLQIISNGFNIKHIKEKPYKELNVDFLFCNYPLYTDHEAIKNNFPTIGYYTSTRLYSTSILINKKGTEDKEQNFLHCYKFTLPNLVVKNSKLYICPICSNIEHFCLKDNFKIPEVEGIDYLSVANIKGDIDKIQDFIFTPKELCKYCNHKSNKWLYHKSYRDITEYTTLLSQMYFSDYERYEKIILGNKQLFDKALSAENPTRLDDNYHGLFKARDEIRFGKGKFDLIIAYNDYLIPECFDWFYQDLIEQTIIQDCVVYFVSDNASEEIEKKVINYFKDTPLNTIFLKSYKNNIFQARKKAIDVSYNEFTYFLDMNILFNNPYHLEELYKNMEDNK